MLVALAYQHAKILYKLLQNTSMHLVTLYLYLLWNFLPSSIHYLIHTSGHDLYKVVQTTQQQQQQSQQYPVTKPKNTQTPTDIEPEL